MKDEKRKSAIQLREAGHSIRAIASQLHVSNSSVCEWVKNVILTDQQQQQLKNNKRINCAAFSALAIKRHLEAVERHSCYQSEGYTLAEKDYDFRVICALYWGEGTKVGNSFAISNSDQKMITLIVNWLICNDYLNKIKIRVSYHDANCLPEEKIKSFWSMWLPKLQDGNWSKCVVIDSTRFKCKKVGKLPYGTVCLAVHNTRLFHMVKGGINYLAKHFR